MEGEESREFQRLWDHSTSDPHLSRSVNPRGQRALKGQLADGSRCLILPAGRPTGISVKLIDVPSRARRFIKAGEISFSSLPDTSSPDAFLRCIETCIDKKLQAYESSVSALTDMDSVRSHLPDLEKGLFVDEAWLFEKLQGFVKGQDSALKTLSMVVTRHCARINPSKPAVLFAVGPSGVGKTHTAASLAKVLSSIPPEDTGYQYLRLDMTEYQESHRVSQLIGSPQGYVGHGEGSQLTDALRANPRTIVLFDEIEKAHPSILRVLMNAMDAGRLSTASKSGTGHEIDCTRSIFVFTSNLDAKAILDELSGIEIGEVSGVVDEVCRRRLKALGIAPEIIGRIGRFLVYHPLNQEVKAEIITLSVADFAKEFGIETRFIEPEVIISLLAQSKSGDFGIRPERYLIDDELGGLFASAARNGDKVIRVLGPPFTYETVSPGS